MAMGGSVYGNDVDGDDNGGDGNGSDGEGNKVGSKKDRVHFKEDLTGKNDAYGGDGDENLIYIQYIHCSISISRTCVSENLWTSSPL